MIKGNYQRYFRGGGGTIILETAARLANISVDVIRDNIKQDVLQEKQGNKGKGKLAAIGALVVTGISFVVEKIPEEIGKIFGEHAGLALLVPCAAIAVLWWLASKVAKPSSQPMIPAFAVQGGHALWFLIVLIAGLLLGKVDLALPILPDIAILGGGSLWLIARPGLGPVILLTVFQVIGLLSNFYILISGIGVVPATIHILLRGAGIYLMYSGLKELRRKQAVTLPA